MSIWKLALLAVLILTLCAGQTAQESISGSWQLEMAFPAIGLTGITLDLTLNQKGTAITGSAKTATGENPIKGTINGSEVNFTEVLASGDAVFKGKVVDAKTMQGTMDAPPYGSGNWTAKR